MTYRKLAVRNLTRRPVRSGLTVLGVALAVGVAVSLMGFNRGYRGAIDESIERLGFQVMIMAKGCPYEAATMMLKGGTGLLYLPAETYAQVRGDPEIESITPIFIGIGEKEAASIRDDAGSAFSILAGIEVATLREMKPWLAFKTGAGFDGGRWFDPDAEAEVVLGFEAAEYEQRKVGDAFYVTVTAQGQVEPVRHEFRVVGVLDRTGTQDDGTVFLPIRRAQAIFGRPDELTILGIRLKEFSGVSIRKFEQRWMKLPEVQVVSLQQVKTTLVSLVGTAQAMVAAVACVAVVVAVIGVVNTILMSVYERTAEIGIMKAIGAGRGEVFQLIWLETLFICLAGGVLGCAMAVLGSRGVEAAIRLLIDLGVKGSIVRIGPGDVGGALLGAVVVGLFAGLYPAWRAAGMRPVEAIREVQ